ncbi:MAG: beta-N-acetylhexosaminidase [Gammaproteobacteria bacterium]|jgi:beta-N-acetylhexosaminidase|nr:beta-N-acetylhexosaminidase [Gammaproteobacteria bacterium]MEA3140785.1 beta-N-acetylhexosaminidase [Gammaproteobacteria bacterium]
MSLGPLMVDIQGTELTPEDMGVLSHPLVGSVILFSRNYRDVAQVSALTAAIRALRTPALLIAVDHEGGRVQRFREGFTRLPAARLLGRRYDEDRREGLALAQSVGWLMASELRAVGVDFSFAPCVDIDHGVSEIIGDRAFHRDPDTVSSLAVAYMAGMREAGMAAVAKHFPGHGAVIADSHVALPVDRRNFVDLEPDIRPYRPLIENTVAGVMGAHVVFPTLDTLPASLSKHWIQGVLRGELGFHGCVFADDLTMAGAAAFGGVIERAELAFAAGCDVLPICNDRQAVKSVLEHFAPDVGSPASQARVVRMRARGEAPTNLGADREWQQTVTLIANLSATPPLVLTEGSHDGD